MIASNVDPFPAADLDTNRSGRLSDAQRIGFQGLARAGRKDEVIGAVFCGGFAVLLLAAGGPSPNAWVRPVAGAIFFAVAALLLIRAATAGDSLTQDLRSGRVETVEGAIGKRTYESEGENSTHTLYYLEVAGRSFEVDSTAYRAAPEVGIVSLYVLPRSHVILNLERMPDRPLPAGATTAAAVIGAAITAVRSQDPVQAAEARAELAAIKNAMQPERSSVLTPPPADQRDPRPLAEAIVGSWQTGPISMAFLPDGTMVATLPGGRQESGRWSVGSDGRLHANVTGRDQATDAWVAGDILTISEGGRALAYRRAEGN